MKNLILIIALVLISKPAFAYIDPGIGAMFIQGLIASLMVIVLYAKKIIAYIKNLFHKKEEYPEQKDNIDD